MLFFLPSVRRPLQPGPKPTSRPGLTLVELLMVVVMAFIVSATAFSIYRINASHYLREEAFLQQQQNLRAALYVLTRDLRMAGNGLSVLGPDVKLVQVHTPGRERLVGGVSSFLDEAGWFRHADDAPSTAPGARAIFGVDGGAYRPDTVTIFNSEIEYSVPLGQVESMSGSSLALVGPRLANALAPGDLIALVNGSEATVLETAATLDPDELSVIDLVPGGRFTGPAGPPFDAAGSLVYNLRNVNLVTYWVDEANRQLMAARYDSARAADDADARSSAVASNIEDLQLYYFFDDEKVDPDQTSNVPEISSAKLDAEDVKAVAVALTSRSAYGEGALSRRRPALFNRAQGAEADNRVRSTLMEIVYLRNHQ